MRGWLTLAVWCGFVIAAVGEEPTVRVVCPAVSYDDHDERGRNGPDGPHRVVLMVVAKTVPKEDQTEFKKRRSGPAARGADVVELEIERILFGSPPGKKISIQLRYGRFPENASQVSHVYGFVAARGEGQIGYGGDDYYLYDRTYPLEKLAKVEALARARLDLLVLSQLAIVIGKPNAAAKKLATEVDHPFGPEPPADAEVTIERVLHGSLKAGEKIAIRPDQRPIPLTGDGPFIYFLDETRKTNSGQLVYQVETRWSLDAIDTVIASLARRNDYPIKEVDDDGEKYRLQEILFTGPRSAALELLQEDRNPLQILGARRIITDGEAAIPDVVQLIEKHLWQPKIEGVIGFEWQENLIEILAILEDHRTDGHIARLIDEVLTKAERGATFPLRPVEREENDGLPRRLRYGQEYDTASNHSLGWLLLTLDEREAARLYGERLIKLRDLAGYGWKDEAQIALDALHIEDHLTLAKVEPRSKELQTKKWPAGFRGDGLFSEQLAFSADGKRFAAISHKTSRVWNTADWTLASEFELGRSARRVKFAPDGESLFIASGGGTANLARVDWRTGKSLQTYSGLNWADSFDVSDDGRWLVVGDGSPDTLFVFDAQSGKVVSQQPKESWHGLAWQPGGKQFLGKLLNHWTIGDVDNGMRDLPFAHEAAWAKDGIWSLEKGAKIEAKPAKTGEPGGDNAPSKLPAADPFGGGGGGGNRHLSVLRLRQLDFKYSVTLERQLSFTATELLVSGDLQTVVALNDQQAEVFAAPDWKSVASWRVPLNASQSNPHGDRAMQYVLSHDGKWLAIAREQSFPQLRDVRTGKVVSVSSGHSNKIVGLNFADANTVRTRDLNGEVIRWNISTCEKLPAQPGDLDAIPAGTNQFDWQREESFRAEDGRVWNIIGRGGGPYERYTSFAISVYPQGYKPPGDPFDDEPKDEPKERIKPELRGEIPVRWDMRGPNGLVPGGQYLHIGTQIFSRTDLKPISAANIPGAIERLEFTPDGHRYLLVTQAFEQETSQRIRLHDTATGQTLLSIPADRIRLVALSPTQSHLAAINDKQELQVWKLAK